MDLGHEYQFAISSCSSRRTRHKQKRSLAFNMVTRHICRDCLISVPHKFDLTNWYIFSENTQFPKLCCYGSMDRNTLNVVARDIHQDCLALLVNLPSVQCQRTASLCSLLSSLQLKDHTHYRPQPFPLVSCIY